MYTWLDWDGHAHSDLNKTIEHNGVGNGLVLKIPNNFGVMQADGLIFSSIKTDKNV